VSEKPAETASATIIREEPGLFIVSFWREEHLFGWAFGSFVVLSLLAAFVIANVISLSKHASNLQHSESSILDEQAVDNEISSESLASRDILWQRIVPNWDCFTEDIVSEMQSELREIQQKAYVRLVQKGHNQIAQENIRANVFCPYYSGVAAYSGNVCELRIVEALTVNMNGHSDRHIRFRPNQGVCGSVFVVQEPTFASAIIDEEGKSSWGDEYELTSEHNELVHSDLRWIVSFPLKIKDYDGNERTGAVLNIDGLNMSVPDDDLDDLVKTLFMYVADYADKMNNLKMVRVTIGLEELQS
ncbi:MAG: hypothetical protein HUJ26_03495, partial [Planctomycetaceae bacterium]|nr:hypothetical protein [Planctomycetaceae bacterium]